MPAGTEEKDSDVTNEPEVLLFQPILFKIIVKVRFDFYVQ